MQQQLRTMRSFVKARATLFFPFMSNSKEPIGIKEGKSMMSALQIHQNQQRRMLIWDDRLGNAAVAHAQNQNIHHFCRHEDHEKVLPNDRVRAQGYNLSTSLYPSGSNGLESILCGGSDNVTEILRIWLESESHANHLLGRGCYFGSQTHFGAAYLKSNNHSSWVIIIAHGEGVDQGCEQQTMNLGDQNTHRILVID